MTVGLFLEIFTILPKYAAFGNQGEQCAADKANCQISNFGTYYSKIQVSLPFFGNIMFFINWILIIFSLGSLVKRMFCTKDDYLDELAGEDEYNSLSTTELE